MDLRMENPDTGEEKRIQNYPHYGVTYNFLVEGKVTTNPNLCKRAQFAAFTYYSGELHYDPTIGINSEERETKNTMPHIYNKDDVIEKKKLSELKLPSNVDYLNSLHSSSTEGYFLKTMYFVAMIMLKNPTILMETT